MNTNPPPTLSFVLEMSSFGAVGFRRRCTLEACDTADSEICAKSKGNDI